MSEIAPQRLFRCDHFKDIVAPIDARERKYAIFDGIKERVGVYVFHERESGCALYVGRGIGGAKERDIVSRLEQHYGESKTGATFFKHWCRFHNRCPSSAFTSFRRAFGGWSITTLTMPLHGADLDGIRALEKWLSIRLRPKYIPEFFPETPAGNIADLPTTDSAGPEGEVLLWP